MIIGTETNEQRDHRLFFIEKGDPGFSPKRNEEVIKRTIEKNKRLQKKLDAEFKDQVRYRADAVASFLRSKYTGADDASKAIRRYFGEKELEKLRGQRLIQKVKMIENMGVKQKVIELGYK